jgi:glutamate N-acetyltransferase/amino-acid N-acetyltransferase
MISVVTTDASIAPDLLLQATRHAVDRSFNMITIDGDMSTNDMLLVMSSGGSGSPEISGDGEPYRVFSESLGLVCSRLAREIVRDAEGARKLFEVLVVGARTRQDAGACARSIAGSNLVKSAVFGCDPNWGRILAAAGYSGADVDQDRVKIWLEDPAGRTLEWVIDGQQVSEARNEAAREFMSGEEFRIGVDLGLGDSESLSWGCDLTYEYVKINSEYTT